MTRASKASTHRALAAVVVAVAAAGCRGGSDAPLVQLLPASEALAVSEPILSQVRRHGLENQLLGVGRVTNTTDHPIYFRYAVDGDGATIQDLSVDVRDGGGFRPGCVSSEPVSVLAAGFTPLESGETVECVLLCPDGRDHETYRLVLRYVEIPEAVDEYRRLTSAPFNDEEFEAWRSRTLVSYSDSVEAN